MNRRGAIILVFLVILIASFIFLTKNWWNQEQLIKNYEFETKNISNKNLAQFYLWTLEDPLMTSANFNTDKFSKALIVLENEENIFIKEFKFSGRIFPISFLKDIITISNLHNNFITYPTFENAKSLIKEYKVAVRDYRNDALNLKLYAQKSAADNSKNKIGNIHIFGINNITDMQTYYNDLDKIIQNADLLDKEISNREVCLEAGKGCIRPANDFSNFKLEENSVIFTKQDMISRHYKYVQGNPVLNWFGPYIASTECLGWSNNLEKKVYPFWLIRKNVDYSLNQGSKIVLTESLLKVANDVYFRVPQDYELKSDPNLKWIRQLETNNYMCPDMSYKAKVNSIDFLYSNYKNKPIFTKLLKIQGLPGDFRQFLLTGQKLEQKFFNSEFPSEQDADNVANYYGLLYKKIILLAQQYNRTNPSWLSLLYNQRIAILNVYLEYNRGLYGSDELLANLMDDLRGFRLQQENLNTSAQAPDLFTYMARSGWGFLYLPFSKSFYRNNTPLDYIVKEVVNNIGKDQAFLDYKEAIKDYSKSEVDSWLNR